MSRDSAATPDRDTHPSDILEDPLAAEGSLCAVEGNAPLLLGERDSVWLVVAGKVDLFAVRMEHGAVGSPRRHLFRAGPGEALFVLGEGCGAAEIALQARGVPGTRLLEIPLPRLRHLALEDAHLTRLVSCLEGWVAALSAALAGETRPAADTALAAGQEIALATDRIARPHAGTVWVQPLDGRLQFLADVELSPDGGPFVPLTAHTWLRAPGGARLRTESTAALARGDLLWESLSYFHSAALNCIALAMQRDELVAQQRLRGSAALDRQAVDDALAPLAALAGRPAKTGPAPPPEVGAPDLDHALLGACQLVGEALGVAVPAPPRPGAGSHPNDLLREIVQGAGIRRRPVALRGEWWRADHGPLLAFVAADRRPVALLRASPGRYVLCDPLTRSRTPLTPQLAASLAPFGYTFYRPFPDATLTAAALLRFALHGCRGDILVLLLLGAAIGILGMLPPIATGVIFDSIIPAGARGQVLPLTLILLAGALAGAVFQFGRAVALLRIETKASVALQAALWDRLLRLPASFFRDYSAGGLAGRAMGIDAIHQIMTGAMTSSLLAGIFAIFNLALMFYYSVVLALIAAALLLVTLAATTLAGFVQLRYEKELSSVQGKISGAVLQLVGGIAKLRTAGAEWRAFAFWASLFTRQRRLAYQARNVAIALAVFHAGFSIISLVALYGATYLGGDPNLSTGAFLGFSAAFVAYFGAVVELSAAVSATLKVIPTFERAKPILRTPPELCVAKAHPGALRGDIEMSHVSFRYRPDGPLALQDVSFAARPGEFIAIVGPSGSGKSTIFRLLLGFETPAAGAVYYDGRDLAQLAAQAVRQQIGVVLQHGKVVPGDLFQNIVGSSLLTLDDAWQAAAMAGLDEDIRRMPMGMHTIIGEGGTTFSGGQRQRLLIARAIVRRPRILLLDEATSALDNPTQEIVSNSLARLQATRIVIAHRLSTVAAADRVYVVAGGRIAQSGTFAELAGQEGLFRALMQRQLS